MKVFTHSFDDSSQDGCLSFDTETADPAKIEISVSDNGDVWLAANRQGFLHLARVFAELGLGQYKDGYHFHKNFQFQDHGGHPEFSVEVRNDL